MGNYGVSAEELLPKLDEFLGSLEGDTSAEELAKAYNMLAVKYDFPDILLFHWMLKDMEHDNVPFDEQIKNSGMKKRWL